MTDSELDNAARMAWNLDGNAVSLNDYTRAFKAGYQYSQTEVFREQKAIRERENESRRRFRKLKEEAGR